MKKLLLILSLFALIALPAYARDDEAVESPKPRVEKRQEVKENVKNRREAFKEKVTQIRDKTKQTVMDRVDAQMNKVNENLTNMWQKAIDRMQELAGKLQTRLDTAKSEGKDTTTAQTALNEANAALTTAENAVAVQKEKDYVIEFTDENGLRVGATNAKTTLRTDLKAVQDLVKAAKTKLQEALRAAKAINNEKVEE